MSLRAPGFIWWLLMGKVKEQWITIYHLISLNFIEFSSFLTRLKSLCIPHTEATFNVEPFVNPHFLIRGIDQNCAHYSISVCKLWIYTVAVYLFSFPFPTISIIMPVYLTLSKLLLSWNYFTPKILLLTTESQLSACIFVRKVRIIFFLTTFFIDTSLHWAFSAFPSLGHSELLGSSAVLLIWPQVSYL